MKRALLVLAVLLLLPAAMVMAKGGGEKGAAAADAQPAPVVFFTDIGHQAKEAVWARIHDYIEQQTGVKFTFRDVKDDDTYQTQLTAAIAAREPIDAFTIGNKVALANAESTGVIQDITDNVNKYGPNIIKLFNAPPGWSGLRRARCGNPSRSAAGSGQSPRPAARTSASSRRSARIGA